MFLCDLVLKQAFDCHFYLKTCPYVSNLPFPFQFQTDGLTIISESDWKFFCEDWQCAISKCVSAEIEFSSGEVKKLAGSCEDMPISEESLHPSNDGANDEVESRQLTIKSYPMVR